MRLQKIGIFSRDVFKLFNQHIHAVDFRAMLLSVNQMSFVEHLILKNSSCPVANVCAGILSIWHKGP